jgi:hypothetical protein
MNDMTPYKPRSRPNPYLGHVINAGKWAWKNREWLHKQYKKYAPSKSKAARAPDAPGGRGKASARTGPGGTSKFKRAWNKLDLFRSVPSINHTHLDLHSSMQFTLRGELDKDGKSVSTSAHIFSAPLEITDLEPFDHYQFTVVNSLSKESQAKVADASARGYPCNQLLALYNNYVVKSAEVKVDCRLVDRIPGGTVQGEDIDVWDQAGQVTVPVNIALLRVTRSELDYLLTTLPPLLKGGDITDKQFDSEQLSRYDRVLREQFGVCPLSMGAHRREGTVSTKWKASVADSCKESDIIAGISDSYLEEMPENGHIGVTDGTRIFQHPAETHYLVILGWISPRCLSELLHGRPNTREVQVLMDCHIRQYIALGDVVETKAGISSGDDIVTRALTEPVLKRSRI